MTKNSNDRQTDREICRVFIGHDGAESLASVICHKSLQRRASVPVRCVFLSQPMLRALGLYWRPRDPLASTEFTYTRFLVPALCGYTGWALFIDADMLFQTDIAQLWALRDADKAVQVVQHAYTPREATKMDGATQTQYPRKNWSSLILWHCGHPMNRELTLEAVNTASGSFLHQFQWLSDGDIGALPTAWNWLEPFGPSPQPPHVIHYTRGVPGIHAGAFHFTQEWHDEMAYSG